MRPKKILLLVDSDEQSLSVTKMVLETNGYRVVDVNAELYAKTLCAMSHYDLILISGFPNLPADLKAIAPPIPPIIEMRDAESDVLSAADLVLNRKSCSTAEMLERIKTLSAKKRGPRKGASYRPKQVASAEAQKGAA